MRRITLAALLLAALATASVGAAGTSSAVAGGFRPDPIQPGRGSVSMVEGTRSEDVVTIRVSATGATDVFGAAFDVTYDPSGAEYVGWSRGTLLEQGGNAPNYTVARPRDGAVIVGASRTGPGGVTASGQPIVSLSFRVRRRGAFPLAFRNAALYDSRKPPQPIGGIAWLAGSLAGA